jgi:hypothetical protein
MPRRLPCATLAALLAASPAFAADHASLTIYQASGDALFSANPQGPLNDGHALVREQRPLELRAGHQELRFGGLPATLDPEAVAVGFGAGPRIDVTGRRVVLANAGSGGALDGAIGQPVDVLTSGMPLDVGGGGIRGTLLGLSDHGVLVETPDGKVHLMHQYASVNLPAEAVRGGSALLLDVDATAAGNRDARLTYTTAGLGWRAAYTADLAGDGACRMQFVAEASIANRSGRDYRTADVKLVAGQPNLDDRGVRMYSMAAGMPAPQEKSVLPTASSLGDYRSFTLAGKVNLPDGSVTLTPLYPVRGIACQRAYVVEDGGTGYPPRPNTNDYGPQDYQPRPIASTLAFTAPDALPAGTLRAWMTDHDGVPALLGEGSIADTLKGQRVAVQLGRSFDLRVSRERTAFHVDARAHTMRESYKLTLTNGGATARTVTVREHPDRWREWVVTSSNLKPSRRTPQLLEFDVPVPAHGSATLEYALQYQWTAEDL